MGEQLDVQDRSFGLIVVHRWNPHEPDERTARWRVAVLIDVLLHSFAMVIAFGVFLLTHPDPPGWQAVLALVGSYLAVSFVHRALFQWALRSTIGKLLLGVVLVRTDTLGRPSVWRLAGIWVFSLFLFLTNLLDCF
ncbi:MAG TPA: RDD family protein [Kutzneria sp.]